MPVANAPVLRRGNAFVFLVMLHLVAFAILVALTLFLPSSALGRQDDNPPAANPNSGGEKKKLPVPEGFGVAPETPRELWDVVNHFLMSDKVKDALPYLRAFRDANPDENTLLAIQEEFGVQSFLRLKDHPETAVDGTKLNQALNQAMKNRNSDPKQTAKAVEPLTKSKEEYKAAIDELQTFGPYAVPAILKAFTASKSADDRLKLTEALGELGYSAVPPLIGALQGPDAEAAAAARALGAIKDRRALVFLFYPAMQTSKKALTAQANRAVASILGKPWTGVPAEALAQEAKRYLLHQVRLGDDPVQVWNWPEGQANGPVAQEVSKSKAEELLGTRLTKQALTIDPNYEPAKIIHAALLLDKSAERAGSKAYLENPPAEVKQALSETLKMGSSTLGNVLKLAIENNQNRLAAMCTRALGQVERQSNVLASPSSSPLIKALTYPDIRTQYAAAKALVELDPRQPFAGSHQVMEILTRFLTANTAKRAVALAGDTASATTLAGLLRKNGYDAIAFDNAEEAFVEAVSSAYVELIVIDGSQPFQGAYNLLDSLKNLRADARSSGIPILLAGSLNNVDTTLTYYARQFPRTGAIVYTANPDRFKTQIERGIERLGITQLSSEEKAEYAQSTLALMKKIASTPKSPFRQSLDWAGSYMIKASRNAKQAGESLTALAEVPSVTAQQRLAELALDLGQSEDLRTEAAKQLAKSIQRHGSLITPDQERLLAQTVNQKQSDSLKMALSSVIGALKSPPSPISNRAQNQPKPPVAASATTGTPQPVR